MYKRQTYLRTLEALTGHTEEDLHQADLVAADQRQQLVDTFNQTHADYPAGDTLTSLFEQQVDKTPEAQAVRFEGQSLSYEELDRLANRIAHRLHREGAAPNRTVALVMGRSANRVAALYACLKATAAYLPLETDLPQERIAQILQEAQPLAVLCDPGTEDLIPQGYTTIVADEPSLADEPTERLPTNSQPHDLAYVIYTSGSTGRPKGVQIEHRSIVNRLQWMQDEYNLTQDDLVLQKTPYSFDVSVWEFFWPLLYGSRLCVAPPAAHRDLHRSRIVGSVRCV